MRKFLQTLGLAVLLVIVAAMFGTLFVQVLREIAAPPPLPLGLIE